MDERQPESESADFETLTSACCAVKHASSYRRLVAERLVAHWPDIESFICENAVGHHRCDADARKAVYCRLRWISNASPSIAAAWHP
jgi:hypothetical protein